MAEPTSLFTRETTDFIVRNAFEADTVALSVTVEVKTGSRRILEYLYSPLAEVASEAMQER
ncbi:hypothetical protein HFO49_17680 [Rhizobium leguminosarum]|uniref:hypothetical protein n=1 Tax=Rhizobium leguminosarum TaxID=384 RepID=UPI0014415F4F|nr:hypothetical protein [Rhizobium leguminosarum]MBY5589300.1 hypothetical protein [Rhizobium leguminosarum]MBY5600879.1 hypothetical protein [Rhizobium leguminosarum]MBY5863354.1 hypothetical protein [Rhizobium leguminosarum]NKM04233.1 hypothetical protein [Rhizobium leguminosarum bv. viciae]